MSNMMICETAIKTKTKITFMVHGSQHGKRDDREIIAYNIVVVVAGVVGVVVVVSMTLVCRSRDLTHQG